MTVIAVLASDFDYKDDDNIIAYVNGEVRGKAKPIFNPEIKKYTYFFNIGGDAEQPMLFKVERGGSIIAQSSTIISYSNNTIIGTLAKPVELHFVKQAGEITVYPNPFSNIANISVDLRGLDVLNSHEIQFSVVDVKGRLVVSRPVQNVAGTAYTTNWNGRNADGIQCASGVYFIRLLVDGIPHNYRVIKQ